MTTTAEQSPAIVITKDPPLQTILSGGTATFTIRVENTGNVTLTEVAVTDALAPGVRGRLRIGCERDVGPRCLLQLRVHAGECDG